MKLKSLTAATLAVAALSIAMSGTASATSTTSADSGQNVTAPQLFTPGSSIAVKRNAPVSTVPQNAPTAADGSVAVIKNVKYAGEQCGTSSIQHSTGTGPSTLTISVSKAVAATWSSDITVSAGDVSVKVGFSVTKTFTVMDSDALQIPKGKYGYIYAYPLYDLYTFEVWSNFGTRLGRGAAERPVGVCFDAYYN